MDSTRSQARSSPISRLFFIDNFRTFLVILVVLHHVALVYGAFTPFYYVEPPFNLALLVFALFNQGWFMGALFLLSGYFTPASFDRKGPSSFLKDRLLRLGIPLVIFYFVLNPISSIGGWYMPPELTGITTPLTWQAYPYLIGMGVMWFVAMLLIFDFGYVAWRLLTRNQRSKPVSMSSRPGYLHIGIFILVLAMVSYLVRVVIPLGQSVAGFPTLAYLPQYLSFFILGTIAYRHNWFRTLPRSMGWVGFAVAVVAATVLFPLAFDGPFSGEGNWQSAAYALWDSTFAVGICLAAIVFFRRFLHMQGRLGRLLSRHSYTVYVIHIPIVVFLGVALRGIELAALPKFGIAAVIAVPACFAAACLVRRLPGASRVL
jgi:surface polysaccharide O-acyltransferase-like enzyme